MPRSLAVVFLTVAIDLIGFGLIIPILSLYARSFGAGGVMIGVLFASYSLMQFLFAPAWGRLSDRIGRRPVLLYSIAGNTVALLVMALAGNLWTLLAARILGGICSANISVASAYVADVTTTENRAKGMGLIGAAFGIGFVVGPFLSGEVAHFGYHAPPLVAAGLSLVNLVSALLFLPESATGAKRDASPARSFAERLQLVAAIPGLRGLFGVAFVQVTAFSMLEVAFVLFAKDSLGFDAQHSGRIFGYVGILGVIIQGGMIGLLVRRVGEERLVPVGLALLALGLVLIPATAGGGWGPILGVMTLTAAGNGVTNPSLMGLASRRAPPHVQGMTMGLQQSMSALARVVGPLAGGFLMQWGGLDLPFYVGGGLMLGAVALALVAVKQRVGAPNAAEPVRG